MLSINTTYQAISTLSGSDVTDLFVTQIIYLTLSEYRRGIFDLFTNPKHFIRTMYQWEAQFRKKELAERINAANELWSEIKSYQTLNEASGYKNHIPELSPDQIDRITMDRGELYSFLKSANEQSQNLKSRNVLITRAFRRMVVIPLLQKLTSPNQIGVKTAQNALNLAVRNESLLYEHNENISIFNRNGLHAGMPELDYKDSMLDLYAILLILQSKTS